LHVMVIEGNSKNSNYEKIDRTKRERMTELVEKHEY